MTARRYTFLLGGRLGAVFIQRDGSISATVPVGDLCRFDLHKLTAARHSASPTHSTKPRAPS